jgi:hypothetical protein
MCIFLTYRNFNRGTLAVNRDIVYIYISRNLK